MQKIIGNEIIVFFKGGSCFGDVDGVLLDVTDESLYIQDANGISKVFVIPKNNIQYCTTNKINPRKQILDESDNIQNQPREIVKIKNNECDSISVYINKQLLTNIPVPPTFKLEKWSDDIMRILMGNPDVQQAISGKIQRGMEYYPGEVYIDIEEVIPPSQMSNGSLGNSNTFTMGGSPATQYLNPIQMVARLNKVASGGNDGKANM